MYHLYFYATSVCISLPLQYYLSDNFITVFSHTAVTACVHVSLFLAVFKYRVVCTPHIKVILGAILRQWREATVGFVISVRSHKTAHVPLDLFS